jgi:hypothetical protein
MVVALALLPALPADAASKPRKHTQPSIVYASRQVPKHYRGTDSFRLGRFTSTAIGTLGDDPDPFIRSQLWRDLGAHFGGDN